MGRKGVPINPKSGERIKILCKERGITQKKFADIIGYTPEHITNIVRGKKGLTYEAAQLINQAFPDYRIEWLLGFGSDNLKTDSDELLYLTDPYWSHFTMQADAMTFFTQCEEGRIQMESPRNIVIQIMNLETDELSEEFEISHQEARVLFDEIADFITLRLKWEGKRRCNSIPQEENENDRHAEKGVIHHVPEEQ